ncbi:hypothetical protein BU23DRAFT_292020 [Bimuria novae-zelandiae CBS 107.79]|uniref:Uncharacterized protein n=1 Tax=Bimuria novae-zelandiae CBS 107.79 TaxID=1447943 RepID=A0A6A5V242_9PLEO|nr:hypothetical protein BU23DRAFT_292020 [Bimuria novae-zelandiae CBS 107.79]
MRPAPLSRSTPVARRVHEQAGMHVARLRLRLVGAAQLHALNLAAAVTRICPRSLGGAPSKLWNSADFCHEAPFATLHSTHRLIARTAGAP